MEGYLTVGEFAAAAGITVSTLHYWERAGLLAPAQRSPAGYRLYTATQVADAQRVRELQALGFLKGQIVALQAVRASSEPEVVKRERVKLVYDRHLAEVHQKAEHYANVERRLRETTEEGLFGLIAVEQPQ